MKIVTDSTADIPKELVEKYDIEVVPLTVNLGDKTFRDYYDLEPSEFYQMLNETDEFPTTSQPSVEEFISAYRKIGQNEDILSIHISTEMSATCQSAKVALQQLPGWNVKVIDSRLTSVGLGVIVLEAAKAAIEGANFQEVLNLVERLKSQIKVYFSVENLDHLQKGGRIGKAQAFVGAMLKIRPILALEDGMVVPIERVRGTNKLIAGMVDLVKKNAGKDKIIKAGFIWGENKELLTELKRQLGNSIKFEEIYERNIGNVITSHAGPTAFGIGYFAESVKPIKINAENKAQ